MKVNVKVLDTFNNPALKPFEAEDFMVVDGALLVVNGQDKVIATFAPGYWISVTPVVE
jgi:hypothetical protein